MNSLNVWGNKDIDAAQKQKDALLHMQVTPHSVLGTGEMKDERKNLSHFLLDSHAARFTVTFELYFISDQT